MPHSPENPSDPERESISIEDVLTDEDRKRIDEERDKKDTDETD